MKSSIYYFTGTGNSLVVARDISKEIEGELISISAALRQGMIKIDSEVIVIVFPVYMWGPPLIIEKFVGAIENINEKTIYAVATYGGMPGGTINILDKAIVKAGGKLTAGFTVKMPGNYTPMYGAIEEAKQQKMFNEWSTKLKKVTDYIKENKQGDKENNNFLVNLLFSGLIYNAGSKHIPKMDKDFWVDNKCNKCKVCKEVCPVNNIDLLSDKPIWRSNCEQCFACLQWCPKEAIQYGQKTATRKRYHHPDVNISDIMEQAK